LEELPSNLFESSSYQTNVGKEILFEFGFMSILKAWIVGGTINMLTPSIAYAPVVRSMKHTSFYETEGDGVIDKLLNYLKISNGLLYLSILIVGATLSLLFVALALVGAFQMASSAPPIITITLLLIVIYFLVITGPIIGVKYRLPIEPILILFVTYFLNGYLSNRMHVINSN
jgi:hypothetical protein